MVEPARQLQRDYATAAEAMQILGIRPQTLYAYVSRGWIHSLAQKGLRDKLYRRDDLARLSRRSLARSGHGPVAASAMNWGEPIFPTSITEITPAGPRYRGFLAGDLVRAGASFEAVAELLWTSALPEGPCHWPVPRPCAALSSLARTLDAAQVSANVLESLALVALMLGLRRGPVAQRLSQGQTLPAAREIVQTMVGCLGFLGPAAKFQPMLKGQSIVDGLMRALSLPPESETQAALQAILILLADHELPPGTFAARVVASAGGTLHSCVSSALCATSGDDVGRVYDRIADLLGNTSSPAVLLKRALRLHAEGKAVPGFDHPLYSGGDPRALQLLDIARLWSRPSAGLRAALGFIEQMRLQCDMHPRQELAVVVLTRAIGLPRQMPAALFVLGRVAGWVAHVQEQRNSANLLRPRARFVRSPEPAP